MRCPSLLGLAVLLLAPALHTNAQVPDQEAKFQRAMQLMDAGDTAAAKPLLVELHRQLPHNFEINESLALVYIQGGDFSTALPLLEAAAREQPQAAVAHANLGAALLKLNRVPQAVAELERAAQLAPNDPQTRNNLGQAYTLAKQPCKAADAFAAAESSATPDADLIYNHALALYECGQPAQAQAAIERMPELDSSAPAQSLLGDIDEQQKQFQQAAAHYLRATQLAPSESSVYTLGLDLLRHWSFDPAIATFSAGVRDYPTSERMRAGLGISYYGAAQYNEAIRVFSQLLEAAPENPLYAEIFGRACTVLTNNPADLCAQLLPLAKAHPSNPTLALYAAIAILHQPDDPAKLAVAQGLLERLVKDYPRLAEAHYQLGLLMQQQDRWAESIGELELALKDDPSLARAHYRLGLAYRRTGRKDEAQQQMALDIEEGKQQRNDLNARMQQITTLLVKMQGSSSEPAK